jgi:hypothetical protein
MWQVLDAWVGATGSVCWACLLWLSAMLVEKMASGFLNYFMHAASNLVMPTISSSTVENHFLVSLSFAFTQKLPRGGWLDHQQQTNDEQFGEIPSVQDCIFGICVREVSIVKISLSQYRKLMLCIGFQTLPRVSYLCREFFIGPSATKIFAERRTRYNNTHGTATFAEGRAVGRLGPSA